MEPAALLHQTFNNFVTEYADSEPIFNQDLTLTYFDAQNEAQANLFHAMDVIRAHELLVLRSVSEASAFTAMLHHLLANRCALNCIKIGNRSDQNRRNVARLL
ncbi:hypothetical protein ACJRO7_001831 [Eucalyptus globulus]|uniref:Uncharacterized protein n=1 Tax=Eucalyptus globulus TaxID=34317 RepID=A0ABD3LXV3_EUCGL